MIITAISTAEVRLVLRVYFLILLALTGYLARKILHGCAKIRILSNDSVPATRILGSLDGLNLLLAPLRLRAFPSGPFGFAFLLLLFAMGKAADLLTSYLVVSQPIQSRCAFGQGLVFNDNYSGGSNYLLATPPAGEDTLQGCHVLATYVPPTMVGIVVVVAVLYVLTCSAWCAIAIRLRYAKRSVRRPKSAREVSQHISIQSPLLHEHESGKADNEMANLKYDIFFTRAFSSAIQDSCKRVIEHIAGCQLSWWPLSEPEEELKPSYTRVYSMSFTKSSQREQRFYDDIPTPLAESIFPKLADARLSTPRSHWTALSREAVVLQDTTLMRLLHRSGDNTTRQQQLHQSERGPRDAEGNDQRLRKPDDESACSQNFEKNKPILFISTDIKLNESVAGTVELGQNDRITFQNLFSVFRGLSSWGSKRATGVKFYRFQSFHFKQPLKRRNVVIDKDKERYPQEEEAEYRNYNYIPRPWKEGKPCPCLSGAAWFYFKNPAECGNSKQLIQALPVRLNDTTASEITAWSIHIEQRHSVLVIFIPTVALTLITLAATLWFIPQWLKDHPGDLQNATIPVTLAFGVIQFLLQLIVSLLIFRWSM